VVFDKAGNNLRAAVMDALGRIAVDEQGEGIVACDFGNLALRGLPVFPKPCLVVVSESGGMRPTVEPQ